MTKKGHTGPELLNVDNPFRATLKKLRLPCLKQTLCHRAPSVGKRPLRRKRADADLG